ncbi:adenylate/guanylate cyclase domain-containing protein, partial [Leptospira sp. 96542]|nr:adenylate/guanylate cyclase domain-containing protein [Leptospira sp. 96542]
RKLRSELDNSVITHLLEARKRKIQELGLDTGRFRIQTFSALGLQPGLTPEAAVDTRIFDPGSALNQQDVDPSMEESLLRAFFSIQQNGVLRDLTPVAVRMNGLELQALYSPYFEHPASTERARLLEEKRPALKVRFNAQGEEIAPWAWAAYAEEEVPILAQLAKIPPVLRARLKALRETNPPTPPFQDAAFRAQYDRYARLVQQRNALYESYLKEHPPSEDDRLSVEALGYLRDSALEDQLLVRFRTDGADHLRSVRSPEDRAMSLRR